MTINYLMICQNYMFFINPENLDEITDKLKKVFGIVGLESVG